MEVYDVDSSAADSSTALVTTVPKLNGFVRYSNVFTIFFNTPT